MLFAPNVLHCIIIILFFRRNSLTYAITQRTGSLSLHVQCSNYKVSLVESSSLWNDIFCCEFTFCDTTWVQVVTFQQRKSYL